MKEIISLILGLVLTACSVTPPLEEPVPKEIRDEGIANPQKYSVSSPLTEEKLEEAFLAALNKVDANLDTFKTKFPSEASKNNVYHPIDNDRGWGQGFWTGILWLAYEFDGDEKYRNVAEGQIPSYIKRIEEKIGVNHHDMGFLYMPSCVAAWQLTGNKPARDAVIKAADHLITRYHETGEFIQAWGDVDDAKSRRLIIDCLMNIPILYWASEETGDLKYEEIAFKHYKTTINNIIREDASTFHTHYFNAKTGAPTMGVTKQGLSDSSCWSRGHAWGMYGIALTQKYKKDNDGIDKFAKITNYFLNRLPDDYVPYWDLVFTKSSEPRDSSAAAIAACGILEMYKYLPDSDPNKETYKNAAMHIVNSLIDNYSTRNTPTSNGLLLHGVYSKPDNNGVDECNIWGDYFYMEALMRLMRDWEIYW